MSTHTAGPWIVGDNKDSVLAATRTIIIAKCNAGPVRFQPASDTVAANARLIAAAPDMLKELKAIGHQTQIDTGHFNRLQRLIERIEGE